MNPIFICQLTENSLKVIKCLGSRTLKREFVGLEAEDISPDLGDKELTDRLIRIFKKLEFKNNPVIISLPRNKVTCRYLKVPTHIPQEIEKIASLQAPGYLPYPAEELITGYQVISTDNEGYSDINLVIVHKDTVQHYLKIFKELNPLTLTVALSSFGLINFYDYIKTQESEAAMIIDIDFRQSELAITSNKKLLFSRSFKIDVSELNRENLFINEINKSWDAYLKEIAKNEPLSKIVVIGAGKTYQGFTRALEKQVDLPVEALNYEKINVSRESLNHILISEHSFASLIGLGLKDIEDYLNLLPRDIKEKAKRFTRRKEWQRLLLFISAIILIFSLGIAKNLDNKAKYLEQLKIELNKIAQEVKPLEDIEKRLEILGKYSRKKPSVLEALYELHQLMPGEVSLVNFIYEEAGQITLRGQTQELNSVFAFVSELEKSSVFKNFSIKVRYATKKSTPAGEIIEFEIVSLYRE